MWFTQGVLPGVRVWELQWAIEQRRCMANEAAKSPSWLKSIVWGTEWVPGEQGRTDLDATIFLHLLSRQWVRSWGGCLNKEVVDIWGGITMWFSQMCEGQSGYSGKGWGGTRGELFIPSSYSLWGSEGVLGIQARRNLEINFSPATSQGVKSRGCLGVIRPGKSLICILHLCYSQFVWAKGVARQKGQDQEINTSSRRCLGK